MRLPEDTTDAEITQLLDEICLTLELHERKQTKISSLSGGQRKRVSVGVELITKPPLLFLDEPTSGLDPGTEEKIMNLFSKLAKGGRTLVLTTHVMENVELLDLIVVLVKGRLAYYGPPLEALKYFDIPKITKIYDKLESKKPEEWAEQYLKSPFHRKYVLERQPASRAAATTAAKIPEKKQPMPHSQFLTLVRRYLATLLGDRKNLIFLLLPAPLIGFLMTIPLNSDKPMDQLRLLLFMAITATFIGCFNAYREIVKEKPVYKRERMVNLQIIPYMLSKLVVLSIFYFAQLFVMLLLVSVFESVPGNFVLHFLTLMGTAIAAGALGLVISAVVNSQEKAIGLLIVVLLPQIIFSGLIPLEGASEALGYLMVTYFGYHGMREIGCIDDKFAAALKYAEARPGVILGDWFMIGLHLAVAAAVTLVILRMQDVK
jgi:energy-coupling factor transporter ATP-binding protein EcfA2